MDWLKAAPPAWYVLADPGHAWKYGVSVRLAAEKDTLVEAGKDTRSGDVRSAGRPDAGRPAVGVAVNSIVWTTASCERCRRGTALTSRSWTRRGACRCPSSIATSQFVIYKLR